MQHVGGRSLHGHWAIFGRWERPWGATSHKNTDRLAARAAVLAGPTGREVVEHSAGCRKRSVCTSTCRRDAVTRTRFEPLHRCLVGMRHRFSQHLDFQRIYQRTPAQSAHADLLVRRRTPQCQAGARKDAFLVVWRQVVGELGRQLLRQQSCRQDALVDDLRGHWYLRERLAVLATYLPRMVALDCKDARW